ncbi:NADP-dependent isocitrate dehydrogenase [Paracoccus sp. PARArs4]|uniref:NADP-dependent isocitrate dehydrogenase n=1 Tax=Paracoccus sp. PARArs4 TaxID=2853442 RepID=UPI0024A70DAE|nr:NADP-dependent isocitrate dehydrogenase [Paracoccus sp. PARArs4]
MADTPTPQIIYTKVDEAPELASASLLPIIRRFASAGGIEVATRDISLAGRIIAAFPERLTPEQAQDDDLAGLGSLVKTPEANVIKLPNISASVPQLVGAIKELQAQGFDLPDYPYEPATDEEREIRARYDALKGSAVNPVLREGNSDRRAARAVKNYAKAHPHSMGTWSPDSKTRVSSMPEGDFRRNEASVTLSAAQAGPVSIQLTDAGGNTTVLKEGINLPEGTVVDASFMSVAHLQDFLKSEIERTQAEGTLFSVHLKATMMKVSDPIIFGHVVRTWLAPVFERHGDAMAAAGVDPNGGLGSVLARIDEMPEGAKIRAEIEELMGQRPPLYMVNSDKGITNLHVPSDVIIDASVPALLRAGGKAWGPDGAEADTNCVIPDTSYAPVYDESVRYFKETGALDPATAGTVQNIGLMAQKAEEYGSHPTTFEIPADGTVTVVAANGDQLHSHTVQKGDIWRMCSTRKAAIEDWVRLAIDRQRLEGCKAVFWLDETRPHDRELLAYVHPILAEAGVADRFTVLAPREATRLSFETIRAGDDIIAISGNVLRDYLTDLFPILELGTSAKMLSIVKLMQGGGMFETGAGGSAPKHVQQLQEENHLRWDSLGEFCALGESLKFLAEASGNEKARTLAAAVEAATQGVLDHERSPGRKAGQPDNRDSHYFFALYWAEALAGQTEDADLAAEFAPIARDLREKQDQIIAELRADRGKPADLGGYYHADPAKVAAVMRPSATLNAIMG